MRSALGRFIQADSLIPDPGSAGAYDRYAYVQNNPLVYTDPSGHLRKWGPGGGGSGGGDDDDDESVFSGYVFIFSCGLGTSCGSNSPGKVGGYGEGGVPEVPFQPLKEEIENLGGTVIYAGKHAVKGEKLDDKNEVIEIINENQNAKGIFLIGHSFGTGANTLAAYELLYLEGNPSNLA